MNPRRCCYEKVRASSYRRTARLFLSISWQLVLSALSTPLTELQKASNVIHWLIQVSKNYSSFCRPFVKAIGVNKFLFKAFGSAPCFKSKPIILLYSTCLSGSEFSDAFIQAKCRAVLLSLPYLEFTSAFCSKISVLAISYLPESIATTRELIPRLSFLLISILFLALTLESEIFFLLGSLAAFSSSFWSLKIYLIRRSSPCLTACQSLSSFDESLSFILFMKDAFFDCSS